MLAIVALIATVGLQAITSRLVNAQIATTKSGEQAVKAAIVNYVLRNNRLPWGNSPICPKLYAKNS